MGIRSVAAAVQARRLRSGHPIGHPHRATPTHTQPLPRLGQPASSVTRSAAKRMCEMRPASLKDKFGLSSVQKECDVPSSNCTVWP